MLKKIKKIVTNTISNPPTFLNISLSILLVGLIVAYLWQINATTQLGIELQKLQERRDVALELNRDLQLTVAKYKSIANLEERLDDMPLAQVDELDYIQLTTVEAVAKR